ncbi:MAG TPA: hypothetical protein VLC54_02425 [Anaeromyxobacter sp.]|jgi:hypothetical protein|nr:hypothetical protein [Anaeromyxobacter sp.]
MPRPPAHTTLDAAVRAAMEPVVKRASAAIARAVAEMAAAKLESELEAEVARKGGRGRRRRSVNGASSRPRGEITRWAADRRARRVPNFVIDMTGLKTKKQIVAKFGDGVVFEKGKPAPKPKG